MNTLTINLGGVSKKVGNSCKSAIDIEIKNYVVDRSKVELNYDENKKRLVLEIEAKDLISLRAALNTYLRFILTCIEVVDNKTV